MNKIYKRIDKVEFMEARYFTFEELQECVMDILENSLPVKDLDDDGELLPKHVDNLDSEYELIEWLNGWQFKVEIFDIDTDEGVEDLWGDWKNIILYRPHTNYKMCLMQDWAIFRTGTEFYKIFEWFDKIHSKGIEYLMDDDDMKKYMVKSKKQNTYAIYCVIFFNDGDFPETEIALITTNLDEAEAKKDDKPDEYALASIDVWHPTFVQGIETESGTKLIQRKWKKELKK